jgi:hypothetical protein
MSAKTLRALPIWAAIGLPVFLTMLLWDPAYSRMPARSSSPWHSGLQRWDIPDLAEHLHATGLAFQVLAITEGLPTTDRAYLTTTAMTWRELDRLAKLPERLDDWNGVVYCERNIDELNREARMNIWRGCCLRAGPFLMFGDPELLMEIRSALQASSPP